MSDIETLITELREAAVGDVCSRSRVMDALLDLRLEAGPRTTVVELIDSVLGDLPGQTLVPVEWWREQLDMLELAAIEPVEPVA